MSITAHNQRRLIRTGTPTISFLRGEQWGTESTQELFQGAARVFRPGVTFSFKPSPTMASHRGHMCMTIFTSSKGSIQTQEMHGYFTEDVPLWKQTHLLMVSSENSGRMVTARDALVAIEQQVSGELELFVQALTSLAGQLEQRLMHFVNDMEQMKALSVD